MKATENDAPVFICQVTNPDIYLPCKVQVDEFRCENLEAGHTVHWVGRHTIIHAIAGSKIECDELIENETKRTEKIELESNILGKKKLFFLVISAFIIPIIAAFCWVRIINPTNNIDSFEATSGSETAINTKLHGFTGEKLENANSLQKALGTKTAETKPPGFIFTNGKHTKNQKTVDVYLDFGNSRSRDLILLNQDILSNLIKSGRIKLNVHAVPTGNTFSMYGPEALAETFYYSPDKAWPAFLDILKLGTVAEKKEYSHDELAKKITSTMTAIKVKNVNKESIQNGTFASWLLSIGDDPLLKIGTKLPSIYVDKFPIELKNLNLDSTGEFTSKVIGETKK